MVPNEKLEVNMEEDGTKPERPWRDIAEEVSKEHNSDKVVELSDELIRALDKETKRSDPTPKRAKERLRRNAA